MQVKIKFINILPPVYKNSFIYKIKYLTKLYDYINTDEYMLYLSTPQFNVNIIHV